MIDNMLLAIHEAGHAVARLAINELYIGPMVKRVTIEPALDGSYLGIAIQDPRFSLHLLEEGVYSGETFRTVDVITQLRGCAALDLLEILAGPVAECRARNGQHSILRLPDDGSHGRGSDFWKVHMLTKWLSASGATQTANDALLVTMGLIHIEWKTIIGIADFMTENRTIDYDQLNILRDAYSSSCSRTRRSRSWFCKTLKAELAEYLIRLGGSASIAARIGARANGRGGGDGARG